MDCYAQIAVLAALYMIFTWIYRRLKIGGYKNRYVFITGCDTGFGNLLALRLDELGFNVFAGCLTETGEDKLRKKASSRLVTLPLDVTKEDSILRAFDFVTQKLPAGKGLWGVVNNAGISGTPGFVEWLRKEDYEDTLAVNLYGVIETTRIFLPLVRLSRGRIVNIASILGTISSPGAAPYSISKHGVEVFSDCLRTETYKCGVTVHILEPGYFDTGIAEPTKIAKLVRQTFGRLPPKIRDYYGKDYPSEIDTDSFLKRVTSKSLYKVVNAYVHALTARYPKYRYKVGWDANTIFRIIRWSPEWMSDRIMGHRLPVPLGERQVGRQTTTYSRNMYE